MPETVTVSTGSMKAVWEEGFFTGSDRLVAMLEKAGEEYAHQGVALTVVGPFFDVSLYSPEGVAALATLLNLDHDYPVDDGCLPGLPEPPEPTPLRPERVAKGLGIAKHSPGGQEHDQSKHGRRLYHGTGPWEARSIIEGGWRFDSLGKNAGSVWGDGAYFSSDPNLALEYAEELEGVVITTTLPDHARVFQFHSGPVAPADWGAVLAGGGEDWNPQFVEAALAYIKANNPPEVLDMMKRAAAFGEGADDAFIEELRSRGFQVLDVVSPSPGGNQTIIFDQDLVSELTFTATDPDQISKGMTLMTAVPVDMLAGGIAKGLSSNFGKRTRRQANLMSKLRGARNYDDPVRGGTGAQYRTRRAKFGKSLSPFAKHPGEGGSDTHSTGTGQEAHAGSGSISVHPEVAGHRPKLASQLIAAVDDTEVYSKGTFDFDREEWIEKLSGRDPAALLLFRGDIGVESDPAIRSALITEYYLEVMEQQHIDHYGFAPLSVNHAQYGVRGALYEMYAARSEEAIKDPAVPSRIEIDLFDGDVFGESKTGRVSELQRRTENKIADQFKAMQKDARWEKAKAEWAQLTGGPSDPRVSPGIDQFFVDDSFGGSGLTFARPDYPEDGPMMLRNLWANTAADDHPWALAVQVAAAREFGLEEGHFSDGRSDKTVAEARQIADRYQNYLGSWLRAVYDQTQADLEALGYDRVPIVRGMKVAPHKMRSTLPGVPRRRWTRVSGGDLNPLSSWSSSRAEADTFGGAGSYGSVYLREWVPREDVWGFSLNGNGALSEQEIIVLGGKGSFDGAVFFTDPDGREFAWSR